MATKTVVASVDVNDIAGSFANGDTLVINNGATVSVTTDQVGHQVVLAAGGYVSCVAGDLGKTVTDDGAAVGILYWYNNTTRIWMIYGTGPWEIANGSTLAITTGTGVGTASANSVPGAPRFWTQVTINNGTLSISMPGPWLNFAAGGYVSCVVGDIGKTVVGATSGHTGTLVSYDNTNRKWSVNSTKAFQDGESISITSGTGAGTLLNPGGRTLGLRFYTGRNAGASAATPIYPQSGLGQVQIAGNWIELGTGTGGADTFTSPFPITQGVGYDYIPCVWVETAVPGVYEIWLNIGCTYGQAWPHLRDGISGVSTGSRGKFFRQTSQTESFADDSTVGAHFTSSLLFGEAGGGSPVPLGAKVRVPNVMITNASACNYYSTTSAIGAHRSSAWYDIDLHLGGVMIADKCLFEECLLFGNQAKTLTLSNCGFSIFPLVSECYGFSLSNVGITIDPQKRYRASGTGVWTSRDNRYWTGTWSFISGSHISYLTVAAYGATVTAAALSTILVLSYSRDITLDNISIYAVNKLSRTTVITYGHYCLQGNYLNSCDFTNLYCYGGGYYFTACSSLTVDGIKFCETMFNSTSGLTAGAALAAATNLRIGVDPNTTAALSLGIPYYFKVRAYHNAWDLTDYYDCPIIYSATPYAGRTDAALGNDWHPFYFGAALFVSAVPLWNAYLKWNNINAAPIGAPFVKSQVFRSTSWGSLGNQVLGAGSAAVLDNVTAATVTMTDFQGVSPCTMNSAGYTNCVVGDIGKPVAGALSGHTGILRGYSNTNKCWTIEAVQGQTFQDAEQIVVTGGTGKGTVAAGGRNLSLQNNTTYYYTLRRYYDATNYCDSAQQVVIVPNYAPAYPSIDNTQNICFQSSAFGTTWVASNCTVTADQKLGPLELINGTATADKLAMTTAAGQVDQDVATTLVPQSFSVYLCTDDPSGTTVDIGIGGGVGVGITTNCALTQKWQRFSVLNVTPGASPVKVGIYANASSNGKNIYAVLAQLEKDVVIHNAVTTTTAAVTAYAFPQMLDTGPGAGIAAWSKGGYAQIEIGLNALPVGTVWAEVFMDTSPSITPSKTNLVATTLLQSTAACYLSTGTDSVVMSNLTQEGYGGLAPGQPLFSGTAFLTNSTFFNFTFDVNYGTFRVIDISSASECHNLIFHNWTINKIKNYAGTIFNTVNSMSNIVIQNFKSSSYDLELSNQWLGTKVRGCPGIWTGCLTHARTHTLVLRAAGYVNCVAADVTKVVTDDAVSIGTLVGFNNTTRTWTITGNGPWEVADGSAMLITSGTGAGTANGASTVSAIRSTVLPWHATAVDCIVPAYVTVYDTIFHELYTKASTSGALCLLFNASQDAAPPYVITGNAKFLNTGGLAFSAGHSPGPSDYITYAWPWKIYGVSSFQNVDPVLSSASLGDATWTAFGLYKEFSISTDNVIWSSYQEMTGANLSAASVSATAGFYLKIKLTAKTHFKYSAQLTDFVVGETIQNLTAAPTATARVDAIEVNPNAINSGTLWVSSITGTWAYNDPIWIAGTRRATMNGDATYGAVFPILGTAGLSQISGLMIFTAVNQAAIYPTKYVDLVLKNIVGGSNYWIQNTDTDAVLATGTVPGVGLQDLTLSVPYDYYDDIPVLARARCASGPSKFKNFETEGSYGASGGTVFVAQIPDDIAY